MDGHELVIRKERDWAHTAVSVARDIEASWEADWTCFRGKLGGRYQPASALDGRFNDLGGILQLYVADDATQNLSRLRLKHREYLGGRYRQRDSRHE